VCAVHIPPHLPRRWRPQGWTSLELKDPHTRPAWEKWLFRGHVPNRQHLLFPLQCHAKHFNEFAARLYLLCFTVYCSLLFIQFLPIMAKHSSPEALLAYAVVACQPLLVYCSTLPEFVQSVVEVNALRVFSPAHAINAVIRDQKAARAVKAILLLNSMRSKFGDEQGKIKTEAKEEKRGAGGHSAITEAQRLAVEQTFDMFDADGGGEIDATEFKELMASLGVSLSDDEAREKLQVLA